MWENLKSKYILQIIFSYVYERTKLNIVKYNKTLQNQMNISLINYKVYLGKYIILENEKKGKEINGYKCCISFDGDYLNGKRHGKGKEYDCYSKHELLYEGEYLNGKRNGQGKEYYRNGNIKFEGEYLNGKKWYGKGYNPTKKLEYELINGKGYVKEYNNYNNQIKYEGEYLNGERNGKGKEYDYEMRIEYEGEYLNGNRNGKGKEYDYDGKTEFKIEYINGEKNGKVKEYDYNGRLKFEGEYLCGKKWNGKGYNNNHDIIYELKNGKGYVIEYEENSISFEGEYLYGEKNGKGKEYDYSGKLSFSGEYINGERNGRGHEYYENGEIKFEGEYLYDDKIKGKEYLNGKLEFEGEYLYNRKWNGKGYDENHNIIYELINGNGKVKEYNDNSRLKYEGEYLNGEKNGKGKEYDNNGKLIYEGEFLKGQKNGKGIEYYDNGNIQFEGEYLDGKKWNGKGYNKNEEIVCELNNGKGLFKEYSSYNNNLIFEG